MHGGANDDLINGDSGGDFVFGDDRADVLWGGRGNVDGSADSRNRSILIDRVFGGRGGDANQGAGIITGGADIIDYKPRTTRPNIDPASWVAATAPYDDGDAGGSSVAQHHRGTDWLYGGWDRDVMEADQAAPCPNVGDRLWDWADVQPVHALQRQLRRVQRSTHDLTADDRVPAVSPTTPAPAPALPTWRVRARRRTTSWRSSTTRTSRTTAVRRIRRHPATSTNRRRATRRDRAGGAARRGPSDHVLAVAAVSPGGRSRGRIGSEPDRCDDVFGCRSRARGECGGRASEPRSRCRAVG